MIPPPATPGIRPGLSRTFENWLVQILARGAQKAVQMPLVPSTEFEGQMLVPANKRSRLQFLTK